jgi:hypothetical protein
MKSLGWLENHSFESIIHREYDWVVVFDRDAAIVVHCLWRLLENGRICVTSSDDGHQFGLPAPMDAAHEVNSRLRGVAVSSVELREGVLDLRLHFASGHVLEILPESAGYEAWDVTNAVDRFITGGGGDVSVLRGYQIGLIK